MDSIAKVSIDTLTDERIPIDLEKHLTLERISLQSCKMSIFTRSKLGNQLTHGKCQKFPLFTKFLRIQHDNFATLTSYPNNCYSLDISENSVVKEKGLKGLVVEMDLQNRLKTNINYS